MTVSGSKGPPSLDDAAKQLGVRVDDLNAVFGVVPVDPDRGVYSVEVRADRIPAKAAEAEPYRGPFANPPIAPLGPIQGDSSSDDEES